ncbi:nucleotidyltransferase family protein [Flavobacterium aestivum]|uniref:nucleotidyltransferase family protein n=1 Tax=Flavobacterium aestivum TaxID=3003257 RepID=UPI002286A5BA|nr:nucleotidyltransferase family protein [Flavobacterium aestivum]
MNYKEELIEIIKKDNFILDILQTVKDLELNDCWIGAGLVRNKVWDVKHGIARTELNDVDVIYYNSLNLSESEDKEIEEKLKRIKPFVIWSVKNQARMHLRNNQSAYIDCENAISFWPETATSVAIRIGSNNEIGVIAPHGLDDLFNLIVKPTPNFDLKIYEKRIKEKQWGMIWKKLSY